MVAPSQPVELPQDKLELSTIVQNTVINNAIAFENRARLESLQSWLRQQVEIYANK